VPILAVPLMARPQSLRKNIVLAIKRYWLVMPCLVVISIVANKVSPYVLIPPLKRIVPGQDVSFVSWQIVGLSYMLLWVFILVQALRQRPWWAHCRWPALCGGCGYTLLGIDRKQSCPECGKPVAESTGMDALWHVVEPTTWRQFLMVWHSPAGFVQRRGVLTARYTTVALLLAAVAAAFVAWGFVTFLSIPYTNPLNLKWWSLILPQTRTAFRGVTAFLAVCALLVGLFWPRRDRHQALMAVGQALPHLIFTGVVCVMAIICLFMWLGNQMHEATKYGSFPTVMGVQVWVWLLGIFVFFLFAIVAGVHVVALRRIGRAARWANW